MIAGYYNIGKALAHLSFAALARREVEGIEAVPPRGPLIVVSNHLSNFDAALLMTSLPRRLYFMGKGGLFANLVSGFVFTHIGVYPVEGDGMDVKAVRWILDLLKRDQPVAFFPEGTRSKSPGMIRAKPGVGYIAAKSQSPILPVGITGTENLLVSRSVGTLRRPLRVTFGDVFSLPVLEGKLSRPVLEDLTDMIMYRVAGLLPPEYRGYYSAEEERTRKIA